MFTHHPSRVRVTGPLSPFKDGFVEELLGQGYAPKPASFQLQLMAHLSRWLEAEGLGAKDLSPAEADRFLDARRAAGYTSRLSPKALVQLFAYLRELGAVPAPPPPPAPTGPAEVLLERYRRYLLAERGFKTETAHSYVRTVRPFLSERMASQGEDISGLSAADVTAFLRARCSEQKPGLARFTVTALRSLLGFLHHDGAIERSLVGAVPALAGWRLAGLPKGLEPAKLRRLLASCDRTSAVGCRDFAIITMLSRLGLRAGEVAGLLLEDLEWRAGEIVVRGKGRRSERLPLPADVGEAIAAYLQGHRPPSAEGRAVFVRVLAPHRVLSDGGVTKVVDSAARRAGLGQIFAHRLRHTAATETLRAGASLPEVGQLLRHRRIETTAIYAKVDRESLRGLARPWPGAPR